MPDGALLVGAGLVCLMVLALLLRHSDLRAGHAEAPDWRGWLLLVTGGSSIVAGAWLWWIELFRS